jgi:hypothetical protein
MRPCNANVKPVTATHITASRPFLPEPLPCVDHMCELRAAFTSGCERTQWTWNCRGQHHWHSSMRKRRHPRTTHQNESPQQLCRATHKGCQRSTRKRHSHTHQCPTACVPEQQVGGRTAARTLEQCWHGMPEHMQARSEGLHHTCLMARAAHHRCNRGPLMTQCAFLGKRAKLSSAARYLPRRLDTPRGVPCRRGV